MNNTTPFICPVCGDALHEAQGSLKCPRGHSFDVAKQGYVNLLMSNRSSKKRHGDDRAMVAARTEFLNKGYYDCLRDAVSSAALRCCAGDVTLLDAGCGEGWYTLGVRDAFVSAGRKCEVVGVDISREALKQFSRRDKNAALAVASVNTLPVPDDSCDLLLNLFAPEDDVEFLRVLHRGGVLIRAVPMEDHLLGLKEAVYEKPYLNPAPEYSPRGFKLLDRIEIKKTLTLDNAGDVEALFKMTPYYYKTGREDQAKLEGLSSLTTPISFCVFVLSKE